MHTKLNNMNQKNIYKKRLDNYNYYIMLTIIIYEMLQYNKNINNSDRRINRKIMYTENYFM